MKRYRHNRKLLSELYSSDFTLMSLLNEEKELAKHDDAIRRLVSAYITFAKDPGDDRGNLKSADQILKDLVMTKLGKGVTKEIKDKYPDVPKSEISEFIRIFHDVRESDPDQSGGLVSDLSQESRTELTRKAKELFNKSGSDKKGKGKKSQDMAATKKSKRKPNSTVKKIQEAIGVSPADGFWGKDTDTGWAKFLDKYKKKLPIKGLNVELCKTNWKAAMREFSDKNEGTEAPYASNYAGILEFVMDVLEVGGSGGQVTKDNPKKDNPKKPPKSGGTDSKFRPVTKQEALDSGQLGKSYSSGNLAGSGLSLQKIPAGFLATQGPKVSVSGTGAIRKDLKTFLGRTADDFAFGNTKFGRDYFKDDGKVDSSVMTNATLYLATKQNQGENGEGTTENINGQDYEKINVIIDGIGVANGAICNYTFVKDQENKIFAVPIDNIKSGKLNESRHKAYYAESRGSLYRKRYYGRY